MDFFALLQNMFKVYEIYYPFSIIKLEIRPSDTTTKTACFSKFQEWGQPSRDGLFFYSQ